MKGKKFRVLIVIPLLFLVIFFAFKISPPVQKFLLTGYLKFPMSLTVFEKNNHPEYPKTILPIPIVPEYVVAVFKNSHLLLVYQSGDLVKEYTVNVRREKPDRETWDDDQTPEGVFRIETMDSVSMPPWERWMRLDTLDVARNSYGKMYPDGEKRIHSYEDRFGLLDSDQALRKFNEINSDQKILRGIGIHGGGFSSYHDWTNGCVGMRDEDVRELFDLLKNSPNQGIGTMVIIQD
jgi:lipoprotein-anchoring transpeptidase ErfK/SrfK